MNSIALPSAALAQSAATASPGTASLDFSMPDGAVPEELFAALLAGQLQAVGDVKGLVGEPAEPSSEAEGLDRMVGADLAALLQNPQDATALVAANLQQYPAMMPAGESDGLGQQGALILADSQAEFVSVNGDDQRQMLAVPAAAFAMQPAAAGGVLNLPEPESLTGDAAMIAATTLPSADAELVLPSPSQGSMAFALPQMQQAAQSTGSLSPVPQTSIPQQVGSQAWGGMVGERVVWMFGQQHQSAEIMLNPPSLGPLEVRLSMADGQANLTFTTQHAPVREALEAATPRLREMLSDSGIGLGNVSVNVGNFSRQDSQAQQQTPARASSGWAEMPPVQDFSVMTTELSGRKGSGLLDLFA